MTPVVPLSGLRRLCGGLWHFLIARSADRTALALERERNAATATILRQLPRGALLLESEHGGRLRVVRMPDLPAAPVEQSDLGMLP